MPNTLYVAPIQNFVTKTLNGAIDASQTTITLSSTTNLQAPGAIVVDRVDSSGNLLATSLREVIYYTGISSSNLTGCTRAGDGSTNQVHSSGAVVETMPTVGMWNNLATIVATAIDSNGYLKALSSPASISQLFIGNRLEISGASVTGIGIYPVWRSSAAYSGPTIGIGGLLSTPKVGTLQWVSVTTPRVASGASVVFDLMNNGVSVFAGVTKPTIIGGGTYVSTASINTKAVSPGNILRADINALALGVIQDITIQGGTT